MIFPDLFWWLLEFLFSHIKNFVMILCPFKIHIFCNLPSIASELISNLFFYRWQCWLLLLYLCDGFLLPSKTYCVLSVCTTYCVLCLCTTYCVLSLRTTYCVMSLCTTYFVLFLCTTCCVLSLWILGIKASPSKSGAILWISAFWIHIFQTVKHFY